MASNTSLNLAGLDFTSARNAFRVFLATNPQFKGLNYDGPNLSVQLDVLALNSFKNAFYTNMVAKEGFLDTAQTRDAIVSHAKELNYLPRSFTSSRAKIDITLAPATPMSSVMIPKGTSFTSKIGSNTFSFVTDQNILTTAANGSYIASGVSIYEGSYLNEAFVYDSSNETQRFVLSNPTVDISSLAMTVVEDGGNTVLTYTRAQSLFDVRDTSLVYFVQPAENGQYEIKFGVNTFGRVPKDGSAIVVEYRVCNGELPNGASTFVQDGPIDGISAIAIVVGTTASGGAISESTESIRFIAPRAVATQERAVIPSDYITLLSIQFPEIQAVNVYGGETVSPPQYGVVFISVDLQNADGVPLSSVKKFKDFIKTRMPTTITPVFVDPDFTYIEVNSSVSYNINVTTKQPGEIQSLVQAALNNFNDTNLDSFASTLWYSQLAKAIDGADSGIIGNDTSLRVIKELAVPTLILGTPTNYAINFDLQLSQDYRASVPQDSSDDTGATTSSLKHAVESQTFLFNGTLCHLHDEDGMINMVRDNQNVSVVVAQVGTVDYNTGIINLIGFAPSSVDGGILKIYAIPATKNIISDKNIILSIRESDVSIVVEPIRQ